MLMVNVKTMPIGPAKIYTKYTEYQKKENKNKKKRK